MASLSALLPPRLYWTEALCHAGLPKLRILTSATTALGHCFTVQLRPPVTAAVLEKAAPMLALAYGIARVRVYPVDHRADLATVYLDRLPSIGVQEYPVVDPNSLWLPTRPGTPVPIGVDDTGAPVRLPILGSSLLVAGNPGTGKSVCLRGILAGLAEQRHTALIGIDPKHVELSPWSPRLSRLVVGNEAGPTIDLLQELVDLVQSRARQLASTGDILAPIGPDFPAIVLIVDEWAELAQDGAKTARQTAADLLRRFVSLGRAVGCSAILCTQKPTADTIDTGTRALLARRIAFRCGDKWQAEAILGPGLHDPADISQDTPGRGYIHGLGTYRAFQAYHLEPDGIPGHRCPPLRVEL